MKISFHEVEHIIIIVLTSHDYNVGGVINPIMERPLFLAQSRHHKTKHHKQWITLKEDTKKETSIVIGENWSFLPTV
jgi:hypothetical protein